MDIEHRLKTLEDEISSMKTSLSEMTGLMKSLVENKNTNNTENTRNTTKHSTKQTLVKKTTQTPIQTFVTCELCKKSIDRTKVFDVKTHGNTTYECVDTKECNKGVQLLKEAAYKLKDEQRRSRLSELERNMEDNYDDLVQKFGKWEKEEQIKMIFGVDFDDLIELPRSRDGCIHYKHKDTERRYTWSMFSHVWSLCKYYDI